MINWVKIFTDYVILCIMLGYIKWEYGSFIDEYAIVVFYAFFSLLIVDGTTEQLYSAQSHYLKINPPELLDIGQRGRSSNLSWQGVKQRKI